MKVVGIVLAIVGVVLLIAGTVGFAQASEWGGRSTSELQDLIKYVLGIGEMTAGAIGPFLKLVVVAYRVYLLIIGVLVGALGGYMAYKVDH